MLLAGRSVAWRARHGETSLPLANLGIEHLDIVVLVAASARFYARIFRNAAAPAAGA